MHAARHGWDVEKDAPLFRNWAIHTGKYTYTVVLPKIPSLLSLTDNILTHCLKDLNINQHLAHINDILRLLLCAQHSLLFRQIPTRGGQA